MENSRRVLWVYIKFQPTHMDANSMQFKTFCLFVGRVSFKIFGECICMCVCFFSLYCIYILFASLFNGQNCADINVKWTTSFIVAQFMLKVHSIKCLSEIKPFEQVERKQGGEQEGEGEREKGQNNAMQTKNFNEKLSFLMCANNTRLPLISRNFDWSNKLTQHNNSSTWSLVYSCHSSFH